MVCLSSRNQARMYPKRAAGQIEDGMAVSDIRVAGRATQGVKLINIREGDAIAAVSPVAGAKEEELQEGEVGQPEENVQAE